MTTAKLEEKRVFLVASAVAERHNRFAQLIQRHISNATVFFANDGQDALFKIENAPPDIFITDYSLPKLTGVEAVTNVLKDPKYIDVQCIIATCLPDEHLFVDEVITGRVQFYIDDENEKRFATCLARSLNRLTKDSVSDYRLAFYSTGDHVIKEGEPGNSVFIVKKGTLRAFKKNGDGETVLGEITQGEFVGEMAHINHEPRNATVEATSDCELIEIPFTTLDYVLFSKPSWAKALVATLAKRLKHGNETISKVQS